MFKRLCMLMMLFAMLSVGSVCGAVDNDPTTVYYRGDQDLPIWVERDDHSMIVFRLSSAGYIDGTFVGDANAGAVMFIVDAYEIEPNGYITSREIRNARILGECYVLMSALNKSAGILRFKMVYPHSSRFPNGKAIDIDNPYQFEICKKIVAASSGNPIRF